MGVSEVVAWDMKVMDNLCRLLQMDRHFITSPSGFGQSRFFPAPPPVKY